MTRMRGNEFDARGVMDLCEELVSHGRTGTRSRSGPSHHYWEGDMYTRMSQSMAHQNYPQNRRDSSKAKGGWCCETLESEWVTRKHLVLS